MVGAAQLADASPVRPSSRTSAWPPPWSGLPTWNGKPATAAPLNARFKYSRLQPQPSIDTFHRDCREIAQNDAASTRIGGRTADTERPSADVVVQGLRVSGDVDGEHVLCAHAQHSSEDPWRDARMELGEGQTIQMNWLNWGSGPYPFLDSANRDAAVQRDAEIVEAGRAGP